MKKYIIYVTLIVIMFSCFFISGLFFMNSGLINFDKGGIDEVKGLEILSELDKLPFISINVYDIIFHYRGILAEMRENNLIVFSVYLNENQSFIYDEDFQNLEEGDKLIVYYSYLPKGEKKVVRLVKIEP